MKKWQQFEELSADIQRQLSPESVVTHNDKIRGKITGTIRQIDISIKTRVGQFEMLVVIDCKDFRSPVDVKSIGEVMELAEDVGANKIAVIASNGFTSSAKSRAKAAGIDLFTIVDSRDHDWQQYVSIPIVLEFVELKASQFEFSMTDMKGGLPYPDDERNLEVYDKKGTLRGTLGEIYDEFLSNYIAIDSYQPSARVNLSDGNFFLKMTNGFSPVDISVYLNFEKVICAGILPLSEACGFKDEINGNLTSKGFTTSKFSPHDIYNTWNRYSSIDEVPFKPVFTFFLRCW